MTQTVALIGLGRMGLPIAERLHRHGIHIITTSRSEQSRAKARKVGLPVAETIREAVWEADIVLLSVFDTSALVSTVSAPGNVFDAAPTGAVIVDLGTSSVTETGTIAREAIERGYFYLDAPVSGGTRSAEAGTLTIMVGGATEAISRARPVFNVMGRTTHMGESGSGQSTKAVNQLILGETLVAVAEGLRLATVLGLDLALVREALLGGFAESRVLREHGQRMIDGNFEPGGSVAVFAKDLGLVEALSQSHNLSFPGLNVANAAYRGAIKEGLSDQDQSVIFQRY